MPHRILTRGRSREEADRGPFLLSLVARLRVVAEPADDGDAKHGGTRTGGDACRPQEPSGRKS